VDGRRLKLPVSPAKFIAGSRERVQLTSLPIEESAAIQLAKITNAAHRSFRPGMLVCQAIEHGLAIATRMNDRAVSGTNIW
jgi:PIN domain nuclease of toxin-antitoxin system